jgi:hypothetical protein
VIEGDKIMKHEDLIKKLENLKTPEIELTGHKQALKMALLSSGHFKERTIMDWTKILAPITAAVLLIAFVGFFNVIQPRLQMAQAKEIVMNDPQVQELMEENELEITEVELNDGEAFVLVAYSVAPLKSRSGEAALPAPGEVWLSVCNTTVSGYILKVDLVEKKATGFSKVDEITSLRYINLEDIDFAKFEPPEGAAPEEADPE